MRHTMLTYCALHCFQSPPPPLLLLLQSIYLVYVATVVVYESMLARKQKRARLNISSDEKQKILRHDTQKQRGAVSAGETRPLLADSAAQRSTSPAFVTHAADMFDADPRTAARQVTSGTPGPMTPKRDSKVDTSNWMETQAYRPGTFRATLGKLDPLNNAEEAWGTKPIYVKLANILQVPVRLLLQLTVPVVYNEDHSYAWDRGLHCIMMLLASEHPPHTHTHTYTHTLSLQHESTMRVV